MEQSSPVVQHQHFSSTCCANKLHQNDGEEDTGTEGRRKNCGEIDIYSDQLVFTCSDKFLIRKKSDCIQKSGDTHSYGERSKAGWEEIQNPTQLHDAYLGWLMDTATRKLVAKKREVRGCGPFRI